MVHVSFKLMKSHLYTWLYLPMQIAEETTCSLVFLFDMRKRGHWLYVFIKKFSWLTFIHVEWNRNFSLKYGKSKASVNSGAPNGSVPQNICSSGQFLLAGRFGKSNMSLEVKCCWEILPYDYTLTSQQCLLGNLLAVNSSISVAGFGNR